MDFHNVMIFRGTVHSWELPVVVCYYFLCIVSVIGRVKFFSVFIFRKATSDWIATSMPRYFSCFITERTFLTRRFTWRVLAMYTMNPTLGDMDMFEVFLSILGPWGWKLLKLPVCVS